MTRSSLGCGFLLLALFASSAPLAQPTLAQNVPDASQDADSTACAALMRLELHQLPEAPARIVAARLAEPDAGGPVAKPYCQVTGYVAPQNKFEMRLPLPDDWNQKFFFALCAGLCGAVNGNACDRSLARGYASVTSNGGHDGSPGLDAT